MILIRAPMPVEPLRLDEFICTVVYVCICNGVTDHQIREAVASGVRTLAELSMRTGCGTQCGSCLEMAGDLLDAYRASAEPELNLPLLGTMQLA